MKNIRKATRDYEAWLAHCTTLDQADLDYKHLQMAKRQSPFSFFRATFYRWAQCWPEVCPELGDAPRVLAVGDLHVENFGTWRDTEGRLIWGVNDFDEVYSLPYTNDLVRLAVSAKLAVKITPLQISTRKICKAILKGYQAGLEKGGLPFVLEVKHPTLRALALSHPRNPVLFWNKLLPLLREPEAELPDEARAALLGMLPDPAPHCDLRRRRRVGLGSLGKPRFVALMHWDGGWVAREAKAITTSACSWAAGEHDNSPQTLYKRVLRSAVRCPDPFLKLRGGWIVRRLAPECTHIDLASLSTVRDESAMLIAMGRETANIHLGTESAVKAIAEDLAKRPEDWLLKATRAMGRTVVKDWKAWQCKVEQT